MGIEGKLDNGGPGGRRWRIAPGEDVEMGTGQQPPGGVVDQRRGEMAELLRDTQPARSAQRFQERESGSEAAFGFAPNGLVAPFQRRDADLCQGVESALAPGFHGQGGLIPASARDGDREERGSAQRQEGAGGIRQNGKFRQQGGQKWSCQEAGKIAAARTLVSLGELQGRPTTSQKEKISPGWSWIPVIAALAS